MTQKTKTQQFSDAFFSRLADERAFVQLFDHLPAVYFFIKDAQGRFIYVNAALRRLLEVKEAAIIGRTDDDFFAPELADAYRGEDNEVMNGGKTIADRVWLVPDREGALHWFVSTKTPLFDRKGEAIGIAAAMQDVENTGAVLGPYQQLGGVVRFISERYTEKISVEQMAEQAHLSTSQLTRRFTQLFQMTPGQYLTRVRINASCSLLTRTDLGLSNIAEKCGFHDASHFVKQFKKQMGTTPGEYRAHQTNATNRGA